MVHGWATEYERTSSGWCTGGQLSRNGRPVDGAVLVGVEDLRCGQVSLPVLVKT
jgi:hypothetical protein